jgi:hypothetical protein
VLLAWDQIRLIYLIFAVLLGLALFTVAMLLLRLQIFRAVKLEKPHDTDRTACNGTYN